MRPRLRVRVRVWVWVWVWVRLRVRLRVRPRVRVRVRVRPGPRPRARRAFGAGALVGAALLLVGGCATPPTPADRAAERPLLDLRRHLDGEPVALGVFTDRAGRAGRVVRRFVVDPSGRWDGPNGTLDERLRYRDGRTEGRVWQLTDEGGGRCSGRADGIVGAAEGIAAGNAVRWRCTPALPLDGRVVEAQLDDWMVLVDDRVRLDRAAMSKFGVPLGDVTLSFARR